MPSIRAHVLTSYTTFERSGGKTGKDKMNLTRNEVMMMEVSCCAYM
jgi:hypothetical protein